MKILTGEQFDTFILKLYDEVCEKLVPFDETILENDFFNDLEIILDKYFVIPDYKNYN